MTVLNWMSIRQLRYIRVGSPLFRVEDQNLLLPGSNADPSKAFTYAESPAPARFPPARSVSIGYWWLRSTSLEYIEVMRGTFQAPHPQP